MDSRCVSDRPGLTQFVVQRLLIAGQRPTPYRSEMEGKEVTVVDWLRKGQLFRLVLTGVDLSDLGFRWSHGVGEVKLSDPEALESLANLITKGGGDGAPLAS